jgi:hypothetical protein
MDQQENPKHGKGEYIPQSLEKTQLPEFGSLPSAKFFAECFFWALGKKALCRVPRKKPSVKENTRRRSSLPSVLFLTHGKEFLCRVFVFDTRQRALCRVSQVQHSAKSSLSSAFFFQH